jgi:pentatricopeptide repeat protein
MDKSVKATTIVFNSLIDCCIKQDMIEKAWSLFEEMTSRSIETDSFTYSTLIKGICLSNSEKYLDRGIELVSKVIED